MKRIINILLSLTIILALVGCQKNEEIDYVDSSIRSTENEIPITTKEGVSDIYLCELYIKVLEDLWNVDPGLNNEISQIGIDLSELSNLTDDQKDYVMSHFASKHNLPYIVGTWEELCEHGYIDKENLIWEDGLFFSIKTNEDAIKADSENLEYTSFDAHKWRGGLGVYFFGQCIASKNADGTWSYTVGQEAIA